MLSQLLGMQIQESSLYMPIHPGCINHSCHDLEYDVSFLEGIPVEKDVTCETQNLVMQIKLIIFSVIFRTSEEETSSSFPARLLKFSLR